MNSDITCASALQYWRFHYYTDLLHSNGRIKSIAKGPHTGRRVYRHRASYPDSSAYADALNRAGTDPNGNVYQGVYGFILLELGPNGSAYDPVDAECWELDHVSSTRYLPGMGQQYEHELAGRGRVCWALDRDGIRATV